MIIYNCWQLIYFYFVLELFEGHLGIKNRVSKQTEQSGFTCNQKICGELMYIYWATPMAQALVPHWDRIEILFNGKVML